MHLFDAAMNVCAHGVCTWDNTTLVSVSLSHSGLVESSGESQWELLSLVDNTQRGSQQRRIEKLCLTGESYYQQSTGESETILKGWAIVHLKLKH